MKQLICKSSHEGGSTTSPIILERSLCLFPCTHSIAVPRQLNGKGEGVGEGVGEGEGEGEC
jgi:hypothetical protein